MRSAARQGFDPAWLDPPVPSDDVRPRYSDFDALLAGMHRINAIDREISQARIDMARDVAALITPAVERDGKAEQ